MIGIIAVALLGLSLTGLTLQDAFEVMLLPRRVHRRLRFTGLFFRVSWHAWSWLALRIPAGTERERFLSVFGALSMVILFAAWASCLILGFGLLEWAFQAGAIRPRPLLGDQLYMSGVTFFTLGFGDVVPHTPAARLAAVVEAGTGFGFMAVVIGYLPVLYQLFSRREAHVIQLDARAGSPPTAATLLCRHAEAGGLDKLDDLLREWEIWGAELLESHLSYPMLVYYRSQHHNQSWLAALAAIMDCCALILVGVEDSSPLQARMTFTMARQVMLEMSRSCNVAPSRYTGGDRLAHEAYLQLEREFSQAGLTWRGGAGAEETLAALRATYEPLLDGLACYLLLQLPGWAAAEDAADYWEGGHRGTIARRLVEDLAGRTTPLPAPSSARRRWARLHARLKD